MKLSYFLTGIIVLIYLALVVIMYIAQDRYGTVLTVLLAGGIIYSALCFFYSFKKERVNLLSDISRNLLSGEVL